jgi:ABC-type bacteriocin/lantibiotic exporter with double-glycine peptidase domain
MRIRKIFLILSPSERSKFFLLLILIVIVALLDMLGVASILPFVSVLANPEIVNTNIFFFNIYELSRDIFGLKNVREFLFLLGALVFIFLIISLVMRAISQYAQIRFSLMREYSISKRLIEVYLHQPYSWFLNRHSGNIGKTILSEVQQVIYQAVIPTINLIAQSSVVLTMLILIILVDYKLALSSGLVLSIFYIIIFYLMKKFLDRIGSGALESNNNRFITVSEAFGAAKEVKLRGIEKKFANIFARHAQNYAINQSLAEMTAQLPRFFIEAIAFGGFIVLILILMAADNQFTSIVSVISLYAFAGYRLLPSLQQVYHASVLLRFSGPYVDSLYKDLKNLNFEIVRNNIGKISIKKSIELKNIYYNYPLSKKTTLANLSISIAAFSKVGIIGPTGSGKSTVADIILGLLDPTKGTLSVDGNIIDKKNKRSWQKNLGYVPQQIYLSDESIIANIAFGINNSDIDLKKIIEVSKIANIHDFIVNELPAGYNTIVGERGIRLSGGQRQRIGIARALYCSPQVLILDEATNSLDNLTEKKILTDLNSIKRKMTIISIAHRLNTVKDCDVIYVLEKGTLKIRGKYKDIL